MKILVVLIVLLFAVGANAGPKPTVPKWVPDVVARWAPAKLDVKVVVTECLEENSFYYADTNTVELCAEQIAIASPAAMRVILNHEIAHAYQYKRGLRSVDRELEADEMSFWLSTAEEIAARVEFLRKRDSDGGDDHPPDSARADALECLAAGAANPDASAVCKMYAKSSFDKWAMIEELTKK